MNGIQPGQTVVALVTTATSCSVFVALAYATVFLWRARPRTPGLVLVLAAGLALGVAVARFLALYLFPAKAGLVRVVPAGAQALPHALLAATLAGCVVPALGALAVFLVSRPSWSAANSQVAAAVAFAVSLIVGALAALL